MGFEFSEKERKRITCCVLFLILLISCIPLYSRFLIISSDYHDLIFHVSRIEGLTEALRSGQFPVRMQTYQTNGYGYPVSIMYGDLFLYPFALLGLLGVPATFSYKLLVISVNALTVFSTYWICHRVFNSRSVAVMAVLLWALAPYRLEDVYLRAAVGEYISLTFLPLILYGFYSLFYHERTGASRHPWIVISASVSAVVLSHLLSIILFVIPLIIVYAIGVIKRRHEWKYILRQTVTAIIAIVGLTLWFLWPMLQTYASVPLNVKTRGNTSYPDAPQVFQLFELFAPMTGASTSQVNRYSQFMPTAIGWGVFLVALVFLFTRLLENTDTSNDEMVISSIGVTLGLVSLGVVVLSSNVFPWAGTPLTLVQKIISVLRVIQFSWRFIGVATVLLIATGCCGLLLVRNKSRLNKLLIPFCAIIGTIALLEGCFAMSSLTRHSMPAEQPYSQHYSEIGTGEYLIAGTDLGMTRTSRPTTHKASATNFVKNGTTMTFHLRAKKNAWIDLPAFNYPNYRIITSAPTDDLLLDEGPNHVIRIRANNPFIGDVRVYYHEPTSWRISEVISALSAVFIVIYGCRTRLRDSSKGHVDAGNNATKSH